MLTRQPFRVVASTFGEGHRSPVELGGGYRYRGIPGWNPAEGTHGKDEAPQRREANAGAQARAKGKAERFRRFCHLRTRGKSVPVAAGLVGVQMKTARRYEQERLAAKTGAQA